MAKKLHKIKAENSAEFGNQSFSFSENTLYFWKYPEDEGKVAPSEQISMHDCFTDLPVSLAPRDVCSRLNTFMLETQRRLQSGDKNALNMHLVSTVYFDDYYSCGYNLHGPFNPKKLTKYFFFFLGS